MTNQNKDLRTASFPHQLNWTGNGALESLQKVYEFVIDQCRQTIEWYLRKKYWRRILGRALGCAAIIILGFSAVIPVLSEIFKANNIPSFSPMWATVAAISAGVLIGLDRLGGWTSSGIRFIQTGLELTQPQCDFQIEWEKYRLGLDPGNVDRNAVKDGLERCRNFAHEIQANINVETGKWAQEFQKAVMEIDARIKSHS